MRAQFRSVLSLVLSLAPLGAGAPDFNPLLSVARTTWPEKQHIGVVCNYRESADQIDALAAAAAPGTLITVVDARSASHVASAEAILVRRQADFLVLLPRDPIFHEGGFVASQLVRGLARKGMPSVGTTLAALEQGAVFSIGAGTGNQLRVTERLRGTVSVVLPSRTASLQVPVEYARGVKVEVAALP